MRSGFVNACCCTPCSFSQTALVFSNCTQAYLSPTHYDTLSTSSTTWAPGRSTHAPRALRGSRTVNVVQRQQQPHEHAAQNVETPRFWHGIDNHFEGTGGQGGGRGHVEGESMPSKGEGAVSLIENAESPNKSDLHVLPCSRPSWPIPGESSIALDPRNVQTKDQDHLEGTIVTRSEKQTTSRRKEGSSESCPRPSSLGSHPERDSLNWYPSRPASAEASVSLISPRTSKKIRRLPTPGQLEEETLQVRAYRYEVLTLQLYTSTSIGHSPVDVALFARE